MSRKWFVVLLSALALFSQLSSAAKPVREPAVPAPIVHSVKVDYSTGSILIEGENLEPGSATATLAGETLAVDGASTANLLVFPVTAELEAIVDELGNYVLSLSTAGGGVTLSTFIPFALAIVDPPAPPGPDCPCSPEWDDKSSTSSPGGFAGQTPYCHQDTGSFVTVQFYDIPANNYWVLWTEWSGSAGYCELYIDGPLRALSSETEYDACANYLRNIVTIWGNQDYDCLF